METPHTTQWTLLAITHRMCHTVYRSTLTSSRGPELEATDGEDRKGLLYEAIPYL